MPFDQDSIDDLKIVRGDDTGKLLELIIRESEEQESEFESESDVDYADYREKASRSQMAWTPRAVRIIQGPFSISIQELLKRIWLQRMPRRRVYGTSKFMGSANMRYGQ